MSNLDRGGFFYGGDWKNVGATWLKPMTIDGVEQNLLLEKEYWNSNGRYYETKLKYVCDLNRDGKPEFITYSLGLGETRWGTYQVYSMTDGTYVEVLAAGWFD